MYQCIVISDPELIRITAVFLYVWNYVVHRVKIVDQELYEYENIISVRFVYFALGQSSGTNDLKLSSFYPIYFRK